MDAVPYKRLKKDSYNLAYLYMLIMNFTIQPKFELREQHIFLKSNF